MNVCVYVYVYTFIGLDLFSFFLDGSEWKTNCYLVDIPTISLVQICRMLELKLHAIFNVIKFIL